MYNQGPVAQNPINTNPRLKFNQGVYFNADFAQNFTLKRETEVFVNPGLSFKIGIRTTGPRIWFGWLLLIIRSFLSKRNLRNLSNIVVIKKLINNKLKNLCLFLVVFLASTVRLWKPSPRTRHARWPSKALARDGTLRKSRRNSLFFCGKIWEKTIEEQIKACKRKAALWKAISNFPEVLGLNVTNSWILLTRSAVRLLTQNEVCIRNEAKFLKE